MSQSYQRPFKAEIDFDQLIWQSLMNVENSFNHFETESAMVHGASQMTAKASMDVYRYNVWKLACYILPDWEDEAYKKGLDDSERGDEDNPFKLHKTIIQLLHRRDFFKHKERIEEISGQLPRELMTSLYGSSEDSGKRKTVSSSSPEN
jgi:hypothetical protein